MERAEQEPSPPCPFKKMPNFRGKYDDERDRSKKHHALQNPDKREKSKDLADEVYDGDEFLTHIAAEDFLHIVASMAHDVSVVENEKRKSEMFHKCGDITVSIYGDGVVKLVGI